MEKPPAFLVFKVESPYGSLLVTPRPDRFLSVSGTLEIAPLQESEISETPYRKIHLSGSVEGNAQDRWDEALDFEDLTIKFPNTQDKALQASLRDSVLFVLDGALIAFIAEHPDIFQQARRTDLAYAIWAKDQEIQHFQQKLAEAQADLKRLVDEETSLW